MKDDYIEVDELVTLTPEIIRNWNEVVETVYLVKKRIIVTCPITKKDQPLDNCKSCPHYFGNASDKAIYCAPKSNKKLSK